MRVLTATAAFLSGGVPSTLGLALWDITAGFEEAPRLQKADRRCRIVV
jgi:hypothetical protein